MANCVKCGLLIPSQPKPGRSTVCSGCGADVRICLNCSFYSPGSHWDCKENIPDSVREKDRNNFCDYFELKAGSTGQKADTGKTDKARDRLKNLFSDDE